MNKKDKIIEELVELPNGVKRAEANPFLITRIHQKIKEPASNYRIISLPKAAAGFAALLLLAAFNLGLLTASDNSTSVQKNQPDATSTGETIPSQVNPYLEFLNNQ